MRATNRAASPTRAGRSANVRGFCFLPLPIRLNLLCCPSAPARAPSLAAASLPRPQRRSPVRSATVRDPNPGRPSDRRRSFSGGSQQKVAIAVGLPLPPAHLLLNQHRTRGVDVETKRDICQRLDRTSGRWRRRGVLLSPIARAGPCLDRVAVFREGRVAVTLERAGLSEEAIVAASLGLAGDRRGSPGEATSPLAVSSSCAHLLAPQQRAWRPYLLLPRCSGSTSHCSPACERLGIARFTQTGSRSPWSPSPGSWSC